MAHAVTFVCKCSANSVVLQSYLWHEFYNIIFKISKLYVASGSDPPRDEKLWVLLGTTLT